jgi:hypothetical protein
MSSYAPTEPSSFLPNHQLLSLSLLSATALLLEISLTRLFSTIFYPPYVFAILSLAVLGIGLGAGLATWRGAWRDPARLPLYLIIAGSATLLLLLASVWSSSFDSGRGLLVLVPGPYLFVGLALVTYFSQAPEQSPRLYQADLLGAGVGILLATPLLNWLGGLNGVLLAVPLFGVAALLASGVTRPVMASLFTVGGTLLLLVNLWGGWLDIDMGSLSTRKPITESLAGDGRVIASRWDSFARTDVVDPGEGRPYALYIDGAAGSVIPPAGDTTLLQTDIGFFPFATNRPERVMIIGPGGGLDIWFALRGQAREIVAVEINRASVDLVNQLAEYHGDLYGQPQVRVRIDEGRSVLRREAALYDMIYLSQVVTLAAERSGYALTENTVYTVEAFKEYLAHLEPDGQIALKLYDELTLTRTVTTVVAALSELYGLSEAEALRYILVFLDPDADPPVPLLLVGQQPFSRDDGLGYAGVAAQVGFVPLFVPEVAGSPALEAVLAGRSSMADLAADSGSDVSPTTDDRPFFYQFEPGLPASLRPLLWGAVGVLLVGIFLLFLVQRGYPGPVAWGGPLYFAGLGAGFILLEVTIIQQTRLFLGHPTPAVTLVLAVLLIGGGVGSGWSGRLPARWWPRQLPWLLAVIVALVGLWWLGWPWLAQSMRAGVPAVRMVVVGLSLAPLALLLGVPFPTGLRLAGRFEPADRNVALAWAANGVMTVAGSLLAVSLAMLSGFGSVLFAGAVAYLLALIASLSLVRER